MADEEKRLRILIETVLDERAAKSAADALRDTKNRTNDIDKGIQGASKSMQGLEKTSSAFLQVAGKAAIAAAAIGGPLIAATKNYVSQVGMAESTSRQWLGATYQLEQSYIKLGRVGAQVILPWLKEAAEFSSKAADYAENHPGIIKAGLGVAAGLTVIGTAASAAGFVGNTISGIGKLMTGLGLSTGAAAATTAGGTVLGGTVLGGTVGTGTTAAAAAGAAGTASILGIVSSVLSGIAAGGIINDLIAKSDWGKKHGFETTGRIITGATYMVGAAAEQINKLFTGEGGGLALKWSTKVGQALGTVQKPEGKEFVPTEMLKALYEYQKQEKYATEDYNRQRFVANRDFNRQMQYGEEDFYKTRYRSNRDFEMQRQFSEAMYYRQRAIAARDFNISLARSEEDYQISRKRAAEDHAFSLKQIMLSGDALQYYYSQRQYEIDKRRAEEDYQRQRQRSIEDFNRQQSDSAQEFALQRAQQLKEFQIQQADAAQDFLIQRKRQKEQFEIQMADLDYQYKKEAYRRAVAFQDQIVPEIMDEAKQRVYFENAIETAMVKNFNQLMQKFVDDWNNWLPTQGTETTQSRDNGGYVSNGIYRLHNNEFVMNATTTRYAENAARGSLTQEKLVGLLTGGNQLVYNDQRQFSRGLSQDEREMIKSETRRMVIEAFS